MKIFNKLDKTTYMDYTAFKEIDLGLSVLWADHNVGSDNPEAFGQHFSWGELNTWGCERYYKWDLDDEINCISGNEFYDVAIKESNGLWRLPTVGEFEELISQCRWERVDEEVEKGITSGFRVHGPNDNHIFLPAAGIGQGQMLEDSYIDHYEYGCYWSGSICKNKQLAYMLFWGEDSSKGCLNKNWRSQGCSIRPVTNRVKF